MDDVGHFAPRPQGPGAAHHRQLRGVLVVGIGQRLQSRLLLSCQFYVPSIILQSLVACREKDAASAVLMHGVEVADTAMAGLREFMDASSCAAHHVLTHSRRVSVRFIPTIFRAVVSCKFSSRCRRFSTEILCRAARIRDIYSHSPPPHARRAPHGPDTLLMANSSYNLIPVSHHTIIQGKR